MSVNNIIYKVVLSTISTLTCVILTAAVMSALTDCKNKTSKFLWTTVYRPVFVC